MSTNVSDDPIVAYRGYVCIVKLSDRSFAARLIDIRNGGQELWFENSRGTRFLFNRADIRYMCKAKTQPAAVV